MANFAAACSRKGENIGRERARINLVAETFSGIFLFDQLNFVAVRIFNKGDNRAAAFNRASFASDIAAILANTLARLRRVVDAQRNMAIGGTEFAVRWQGTGSDEVSTRNQKSKNPDNLSNLGGSGD